MIIGKVLGPVVATMKVSKYSGQKLLEVLPQTPDGKKSGEPLVAIDIVDSGIGDKVLVCIEGKSAMDAIGLGKNPVDAVIVAVIDKVTYFKA